MKEKVIPLDLIYVPVKRKKELKDDEVEVLAESILEHGLQIPISVRVDMERKRFVLVQGLKRLEAVRMLGEDQIKAQLVEARQH